MDFAHTTLAILLIVCLLLLISIFWLIEDLHNRIYNHEVVIDVIKSELWIE